MSDTSIIQQLQIELSILRAQVERTARYQAEKGRLENEYQSSQQRFKTIFEKSSVGKKIINDQLQIVNVNQALLDMLGYTEDDLLGERITNFTHSDFVEHWKQLQHELWTTDLPSFNFDTCLIKKDKTTLWMHVTTIQIEDNGNTLGYTTLEDISERKELERLRNLVREQEHRQLIAETILNTQEEERKRVAESLHNGLGQLLYGVKLSLNHINITSVDEGSLKALENSQKLLSDCIRECRGIAHDLMPAMLEAHGLKEATIDICRQLSDSTRFVCQIKGLDKRLDNFLEVAIYRMVQELMMNVINHAEASNAQVSIAEERNAVHVKVEDNGKGFNNTDRSEKGIGMQSIRHKVALLNGDLKILSENGKGTTIDIVIPKKVN